MGPAGGPVGEGVGPGVLLIEDDDDARLIYRTILVHAGLDVTTACDGLAGLVAASVVQPSVIVSNIELPRLDGLELLKRIKRDPRLRTIPIIALSGRAMSHDRSKLRDAGFDEVLLKPIDPRGVLAAVRRQLAGKQQTAPTRR